jgi:KTSC domain
VDLSLVNMQRIPIISTTLKSAGYADSILEIEFHDGAIYHYFDVPAEVAKSFMESESKGQHFVTRIRERYEFARVESSET